MKPLIISLFIILTSWLPSEAQNVTVSTAFDSSRIYIGDQINFIIKIDQPSDLQLNLPFFKDTLIKNIEVLAGPSRDSIHLDGNRLQIIEKYLVTSFDSGFYEIPPVPAVLKSDDGVKRFYSDYSFLEVVRVRIAPQDTSAKIFDIIQPYRAPLTLGEILPWILLAAIFAVVIWLIIRYLRKLKNKRPENEPVINIEPAHIIALHELDILKEEMLWQKGETKKYYTRLTEILRQYLENRYGILSLELTTSETLGALVKTGFKKDESYKTLKNVLTGADLVKFAKYKPLEGENEQNLDNAYIFVNMTKASEVVPEPDVKSKIQDV
jgi:hypothetical protein